MNEMDVDLWRLFVQIATHGSLTKAASARNVAQSVVSRQLATIERLCGGYLFERTGRGVRLNEAGGRIFPRVVAWLDEGGKLTHDVRNAVTTPSGNVRVGILESIDGALASNLYNEMLRLYPQIRLRIYQGIARQIAAWIDGEAIDIGILIRNMTEARRGDVIVGTHDSVLIGPSGDPLTRAEVVPFRKLDGLPLVLGSSPSAWREMLQHLARKKGIKISVAVECDSIPIQKRLVADSGLYAIQGAHAVRDEVRTQTLQAARIVAPEIRRPFVLSVPEGRPPTAACQATLDVMKRLVSEVVPDRLPLSERAGATRRR